MKREVPRNVPSQTASVRIVLLGASLALIAGFHATVWPAAREVFAHRYPAHGLWRLAAGLLRDAVDPALPWTLCAGAALAACGLALALWRPALQRRLASRWLSPLLVLGAVHLAAVVVLHAWPALGRRAAGRAPDVVFVIVDTLRADHLGFAGYSRPTSPHLDRLATDSVVFDNAFAQAPWTSPSVASLLTSQYPAMLGYADSKDPAVAGDDALFLAEILAEHGYLTHAVISHTYVGSRLGFDQGMTAFDEGDALGPLHVSSESVTDKAIAALDLHGARDRPLFLFVHYFDPHFSYILHQDFDFDPDYRGELSSGEPYGSLLDRARARSLSERDLRYLRALYDSEIRFTDQHAGRLLEHLRRQELYDDTVIVFAADHGEAFLDRKDRWIGHGKTLFGELIHVPLVIKLPAGKSAGTRVSTPVALLDVVPSLLELLDLPAPPGLEGRALPLVAPRALRGLAAEPVFSETMARRRWLQSVVAGRLKLIADRKTGRFRLFDLEADPGERHNLAEEDPQTADRLARVLRTWNSRLDAGRREGARPNFTAEEIQRLKALGYLQ